jgi:hypothetical protein
MAEGEQLAERFQGIVMRLYQLLGWRVEAEIVANTSLGRFEVDAVATAPNRARQILEIKWRRGPIASTAFLRNAAAEFRDRTSRGRDESDRVLVVSGAAAPELREWLLKRFNITVQDRAALREMAGGSAIALELEEIFSQSDRRRLGDEYLNADAFVDAEGAIADNASRARGLDLTLLERLDALEPGVKNAKEFERLCSDIIGFVFGDFLLDRKFQSPTELGLDVLDIVYRVKPGNRFWDALTRDFRARVIVFECKNHSGAIGPQQIFTTERYLSRSAMRPICFMLCRKPAKKNVLRAAAGALRESGKLVVMLSDEDLKDLIKARVVQRAITDPRAYADSDPTELLDQKVYEYLVAIGR